MNDQTGNLLSVAALLAFGGFLAFSFFRSRRTRQRIVKEKRDRESGVARASELLVQRADSMQAADVERVLSECGVEGTYREVVVRDAYRELIRRSIKNDGIADSEFTTLAQIRRALGIPESEFKPLLAEIVIPMLREDVIIYMEDKRITEEELAKLQLRAARYRIIVDLHAEGMDRFRRYVDYARWETGVLPVVVVPTNLQRGEVCHFAEDDVQWNEVRTTRTRKYSSGFVSTTRIWKGFYYRRSNVTAKYDVSTGLHVIDSGRFLVTSKRLIFVGEDQTRTLPWTSILELELFSNAIVVTRTRGKPVTFILSDAESAGIICGLILSAREE